MQIDGKGKIERMLEKKRKRASRQIYSKKDRERYRKRIENKEKEKHKREILYEPECPVVPVRHTAVQQTSSSQPS